MSNYKSTKTLEHSCVAKNFCTPLIGKCNFQAVSFGTVPQQPSVDLLCAFVFLWEAGSVTDFGVNWARDGPGFQKCR